MNKRMTWIGLPIALLIVTFSSVQAATFLGDDELVRTTQALTGNFFAAGQTIIVEDAVPQDFYGAANTIHIDKDVAQNVHAAGQLVKISGNVGQDVLAAGNTVEVTGDVGQNIFVAGSQILIHPTNAVGQNVYVAGANITINGLIKGNVYVTGGKITLPPTAVIQGDFVSYGDITADIQDGATIKGTTRHIIESNQVQEKSTNNTLMTWVRHVLSLFIGSWVLVLLMPTLMGASVVTARQRTGKNFLTGLIWIVAFVPLTISLMITGIGLPLGFITLGIGSALILVASLLSVVVIGAFASYHISRQTDPAAVSKSVVQIGWPQMLLGAVLYASIQLLGVIGWAITSVIVVITLGSLLRNLWTILRPQSTTLKA